MIRTIKILSVFLLMCCGTALAQEPGFFGKRTFIEFGAHGQLPIVYNLVTGEKGYVEKGGTLHKSYNLKDFSVKAALGYVWTENFGVALEYNHHFYQANPLRSGELNRQYVDSTGALVAEYIRPEVAFLEIEERIIMPKFVFTYGDGKIPGGFTQEFGLGYCMIGIKNREAAVAYSGDGGHTAESISQQLVDPEVEELKGFCLMYGLRMNFPVTRSFLVNVGVRYNYSWMQNKKGYRDMQQTEAWLSGQEVWRRLQQRRVWGIMTFGVGGVICL